MEGQGRALRQRETGELLRHGCNSGIRYRQHPDVRRRHVSWVKTGLTLANKTQRLLPGCGRPCQQALHLEDPSCLKQVPKRLANTPGADQVQGCHDNGFADIKTIAISACCIRAGRLFLI